MSKVRDKLRALHAPRPTELPEGVEVRPLAAPEGATTEGAARADAGEATKAVPERPRPQCDAAGRREPGQRPKRQPRTEPTPTPARPAEEPHRQRQASRAPKVSESPDRAGGVPHRNVFPPPGATVVRRDAFARWRLERRAEPEPVRTAVDSNPPMRPTAESPSPGTSEGHTSGVDSVVDRGANATAPRAAETALEHLAAGRSAWSRNRPEKAADHLEAALDLGLDGRDWWSAARTLVDAYLALHRDDDARIVLEELVDVPSSDPFPFLALADAVAAEDAERAAELRERARKIAPWC